MTTKYLLSGEASQMADNIFMGVKKKMSYLKLSDNMNQWVKMFVIHCRNVCTSIILNLSQCLAELSTCTCMSINNDLIRHNYNVILIEYVFLKRIATGKHNSIAAFGTAHIPLCILLLFFLFLNLIFKYFTYNFIYSPQHTDILIP